VKKDLLERLKKYTLSAGAIAATTHADAQVLYTDVQPDSIVFGQGNSYMLDVNNDGLDDFSIHINISSFTYGTSFSLFAETIRVTPQGSNGVAVSNGSFSSFPYALGTNVNIGSSMFFASYASQLLNAQGYNNYMGNQYPISAGNWQGVQNKFLGLRLILNGQTHYGWVRLDVNSASQFIVKDYAIELTAESSINTGDIEEFPTLPATDVIGEDVSDNKNGSDVRVSFTKATDESSVSEYRIMLVKIADAATFGLGHAAAVSIGNYVSGMPTGNNVSVLLSSNDKDVDGDLITEYQPYRAFVLSKADGVNANVDALSLMSPVFILTSPTGLSTIEESAYQIWMNDRELNISASHQQPIRQLTIFDMKGAQLRTSRPNSPNAIIELTGFEAGIYLVQLVSENKTCTYKIFIP